VSMARVQNRSPIRNVARPGEVRDDELSTCVQSNSTITTESRANSKATSVPLYQANSGFRLNRQLMHRDWIGTVKSALRLESDDLHSGIDRSSPINSREVGLAVYLPTSESRRAPDTVTVPTL
jgi:hypothetical protein